MKKILSMVLAVVMLASTLSVCFVTSFVSSAEVETVNLDGTTQWEYIKTAVDTAAPEGWTTGEDSSTDWVTGTLPLSFGYDHFECYARTSFDLTDAASISVMKMDVKWDEDAIMYLNGEQIWSASGYRDHAFLEVDLSEHTDKLANGENILSVQFRNVNGGSLLDLSMEISSSLVDSNGYLYASGATCYNVGFGGAENVLDWDNNSCCGDGPDTGNIVIVHYEDTRTIGEVFISCKNEGAPEGGGAWGTYDLYAICNGIETKIASGVEAWADGVTVTLNGAYNADSIKAVITSWNGSKWSNIADMGAKPAADGAAMATRDADGNAILSSVTFQNVYYGSAEAILDKNNATCAGDMDKSGNTFILNYTSTFKVGSVYIECKSEGGAPEVGACGTYDIYAIKNGISTKIAEDVEVERYAGTTVTFDEATYEAEAIKVVITDWYGTNWANIAELSATAAADNAPLATYGVDGQPVISSGVTSFPFNGLNAVSNILDGNNGTCCGTGFYAGMSITLNYANKIYVDGMTIDCKDEGYPVNENAGKAWGTYDIYVVNGTVVNKVAANVEAWPSTYADKPEGANVVDLGATYPADSIIIVITSWNGTAWGNVADFSVDVVANPTELAKTDVDGKPVVISTSEKLTNDWGDVNSINNMLDGNAHTMWGTNWYADTESVHVQVNFAAPQTVGTIGVYAMNEQAPASGAFGLYDVYVIVDGEEILVKEGLEAWPENFEGAPKNAGIVALESAMEIDGYKIVVTSWNTTAWAGVATVTLSEEVTVNPADIDGDGSVMIGDVTLLLNYLSGDESVVLENGVGDLDNDGEIMIGDVTALLNYLATQTV